MRDILMDAYPTLFIFKSNYCIRFDVHFQEYTNSHWFECRFKTTKLNKTF